MPGTWAQRQLVRSSGPGAGCSCAAAARRGTALPFAVTVDGRFAGHVMVGNVVREPLLSAYVGYWVDSRVTGGGVITAAVALVVDHCFGPVGLHRLEATVRPENAASLRVLGKLGFREEGLFRRYLDVDGAWRDHLCFALTAEELPPGGLVGRLVAEGRAAGVIYRPRRHPPESRSTLHVPLTSEPRRDGASLPRSPARRSLPLAYGSDLAAGEGGTVLRTSAVGGR